MCSFDRLIITGGVLDAMRAAADKLRTSRTLFEVRICLDCKRKAAIVLHKSRANSREIATLFIIPCKKSYARLSSWAVTDLEYILPWGVPHFTVAL